MGDLHSIEVIISINRVLRIFGIGIRNERKKMDAYASNQYDLLVKNAWFEKWKIKKYTWKNTRKWKLLNSCKTAIKIHPGSDIDSDQNVLLTEVETRLKQMIEAKKITLKLNFENIKNK